MFVCVCVCLPEKRVAGAFMQLSLTYPSPDTVKHPCTPTAQLQKASLECELIMDQLRATTR